MGRPRNFDVDVVTAAAADTFCRLGYEATSLDDIVSTTGLHRGSLYGAFGSKRGIFLAALQHLVDVELPNAVDQKSWAQDKVLGAQLDLILIASLELAPRDDAVRDLVDTACTVLARALPPDDPLGPASLLGHRLLKRARTSFPTADEPERGVH